MSLRASAAGGSAAYLGKMLPREKNESEEESCKVEGFKTSQSRTWVGQWADGVAKHDLGGEEKSDEWREERQESERSQSLHQRATASPGVPRPRPPGR